MTDKKFFFSVIFHHVHNISHRHGIVNFKLAIKRRSLEETHVEKLCVPTMKPRPLNSRAHHEEEENIKIKISFSSHHQRAS